MARQRSRVDWLLEGDRNTEFFHAHARSHKGTNKIHSLLREDGSLCDSQGEIKGMMQEFYENIFTSQSCGVLDAIPQSFT